MPGRGNDGIHDVNGHVRHGQLRVRRKRQKRATRQAQLRAHARVYQKRPSIDGVRLRGRVGPTLDRGVQGTRRKREEGHNGPIRGNPISAAERSELLGHSSITLLGRNGGTASETR